VRVGSDFAWLFSKFLSSCIFSSDVSIGAVAICWFCWYKVASEEVTLGEEEIERYDVVSDIIDNRLSYGAVGGSRSDGVIFGDEEKEKRDEVTDNNDDRFILL